MSFLRLPFLFLKQNTSSPIASALIAFLYPILFSGGNVTKPRQPSRNAEQDYSGKFVEYDCKSALGPEKDVVDCRDKAKADVISILNNSDIHTFLYVKNAQLLETWQGVPRRLQDQVHFDSGRSGFWLGFTLFFLCILAFLYRSGPIWEDSGWILALLSVASSLLMFLIPVVALKGVEDRIVDAQVHQTELDFSSHAMRIDGRLDYLESLIDTHKEKLVREEDLLQDEEMLHDENSVFVGKMLEKLVDASDDVAHVAQLAPSDACSARASRLRSRAQNLKATIEAL